MSFRGRHDHTLDKKGRVSIPAGFRLEMQRLGGERTPILTRGKQHLVLYPADVFDAKEAELASKSNLLPDVENYQRFLIGGCSEVQIDSQGRVTIPAAEREHAGLEGKVTLSGVVNKIEIWDTDRFEAAQKMTLGRLEEIQTSVDQVPGS